MWISWQVIRSSSLLQTERSHTETDVCARVNDKCTSDTLSKDIDTWTDSFQSYRTKDRGFDHKLTFRDRSADVKRNLYNILMRDVSFTHNCQKHCCFLFYHTIYIYIYFEMMIFICIKRIKRKSRYLSTDHVTRYPGVEGPWKQGDLYNWATFGRRQDV